MRKLLNISIMLGVMVALLIVPFSVSAQETFTDEELDAIAFVSDAYEKMAELESVYIDGTQIMDQSIAAQGQSQSVFLTQEISGYATEFDDESAIDMSVVQNIITETGGQSVELDMTMDMIFVDGFIYAQVRDVSEIAADFFPEGWVNLTINPTGISGMEILNLDQINSYSNFGLQFPVTAETVATIEEFDDFEAIEGVETRFFAVSLTGDALIDTAAFEMLTSMMNAEALGIDVDEMIRQMLENASFEIDLWIGVEDNFIYRTDVDMVIDAEIVLDGLGTFDMQQSTFTTVNFSEFDEPVEIVAPVD